MGFISRDSNSYLGLLKASAPEIITLGVRISTLEIQKQRRPLSLRQRENFSQKHRYITCLPLMGRQAQLN